MDKKLPDTGTYAQMVKKASPGSPAGKNLFFAFLIGGGICAIGELLLLFYQRMGLTADWAAAMVSVTLIGASALLTGLGVYDDLARFAGAGSLVPITGFANSVVSPALEFKTEGFVTGTAVKIFTIAGPVIVYLSLIHI